MNIASAAEPERYPITDESSNGVTHTNDTVSMPPLKHEGYLVVNSGVTGWVENCRYFSRAEAIATQLGGKRVVLAQWVRRTKGILPRVGIQD